MSYKINQLPGGPVYPCAPFKCIMLNTFDNNIMQTSFTYMTCTMHLLTWSTCVSTVTFRAYMYVHTQMVLHIAEVYQSTFISIVPTITFWTR